MSLSELERRMQREERKRVLGALEEGLKLLCQKRDQVEKICPDCKETLCEAFQAMIDCLRNEEK
jgi:hypothetical protein